VHFLLFRARYIAIPFPEKKGGGWPENGINQNSGVINDFEAGMKIGLEGQTTQVCESQKKS
jgi:hypothetical protein